MRSVNSLLLVIFCIACAAQFFQTQSGSGVSMMAYAQEDGMEVSDSDATAEEVDPMAGVKMDGFSAAQEEELAAGMEKVGFQAEVSRLMDILINSLYKNKDIFLRELISNGSDALDKIRFLAVSDSSQLGEMKELKMEISFNEQLKTLTIRDTGIGMTKADMVNNLGTLAKSGTKNFLETMQQGGDVGMIGQFGVGFYSAFLVADSVRVVSKHNDDEQYIWESTGSGDAFSIAKDPRGNTLGRGSEITLFLKDDASEFSTQHRLEEIVKHHSEFITFPIYLHKKTEEIVEESESEDKDTNEDGLEVDEGDEEEEEGEKKTKKVEKWDWHRINGNVAIWSRDKDDITEEEYQKFYRVISKDATSDAHSWIHFKAEGEVEFKSILYIPNDAGMLYDEYSNTKAGVRLYVRKVLIQDDFEDLLPRYLNFIRGVADSDDLPLNVSRETLQQHKILRVMSKKLVRKVLEMLRKMSTSTKVNDDEEEMEGGLSGDVALDDPEHPYIKFWENFGKSIKLGVMEDIPNKSKLAKLLRFKTSKSEEKWVSLDAYVENKPEWQKDIYFIAAESQEVCEKSPFMEMARKKDIEVLFLTDPVDEYTVQSLGDFDGLKLQSLTKEGLRFGDEDEDTLKKRTKLYREQYKPLTKYMKELYDGKINKIAVSQRVESSPAIIVTSQYGHSANMERIARAQTFGNPDAYKQMLAAKTLELNPRHPMVAKLLEMVVEKPTSRKTKDMVWLLYDTALMASGFTHEDNDSFSERMYRTIAHSINLESTDLLDEIEIPAEPEPEPVVEEEEMDFGEDMDGDHDEF